MKRFWDKVDQSGDCWIWMAARDPHGYGRFNLSGRIWQAHRLSYEWDSGEIPAGLVIDHLCSNRACVNPAHLEAVTQGENVRRGEQANRTHCPRGHDYDSANTYITKTGKRRCRACNREWMRNHYLERAAAC